MAIDQLMICRWKDRRCQEEIVENPTWQEIESAIDKMNGIECNDIYLTPDQNNLETYLAIGGGEDDQYVVSGSINNEEFPTYIHPNTNEVNKVTLMVGGQDSEFPNNWVVSNKKAKALVRSFYEDGGFNKNVPWQNV